MSANNGRLPSGKFAKGNPGGPGNPHAARVGQLRALFFESISDADFQAIIATLISLAKSGDLAAVKILLERALGRVEVVPEPAAEDASPVGIVRQLLTSERGRQILAELTVMLDDLPDPAARV